MLDFEKWNALQRIAKALEELVTVTKRLEVLNKAVAAVEKYEARKKHDAINRHFEKQLMDHTAKVTDGEDGR